ncbi:unnamed protein product [Lymnaea stagnalis]|uniref:Uncharacterized protein n=1 Tax=Lymnaea stagnalis TaxID=6523 RepID=A0AAV2HIW0_LYMST
MGLQLRVCPVENSTIDFDEDVCVHEDVCVEEDVRGQEDVCVHEFEWCTDYHPRPETDISGTYDRHFDHMKTRRNKNCFFLPRKKPQANFTTTTLTEAKPCHYLNFLGLKLRLKSFEMAPVHEQSIIRQLAFVGFFWDGMY